jgi:iron complex outermembrane receptor protein
MNTRGLVAALAALIGLTAVVSPACAIEEIIVTAQRKEEKLQDVPLAVTALGAGQLDKLQVNVVEDIGQNVPNMQTYTITAGAEAIQVHARGASVQNPGFNASESPVGFYEDEVYRGRLASINLDLADVERIEVLRGPQATLYGRNTLAGAVKIVTRTPGDENFADLALGYGSFDTWEASGAVGGPLEKGSLAGSIAGLYTKRSGGWQFNPVTGEAVGAYENRALRGKLHWYGTENFDVVLSAWGVKATNDGYNGVPYVPFSKGAAPPDDLAPVPSRPLNGAFDGNYSPAGADFGDTSQAGATLTSSYRIGDLTLRSITGFAHIDDKFGFDLAGGGFLGVPGVSGVLIRSDASLSTWSEELQLLGRSFGGGLDWIAGLYYLNEDGAQSFGGQALPFLSFRESTDTNTDSYAIFAEGTWHFTNALSLVAGARYTNDDKTYRNECTAFVPGSCIVDSPPAGPVVNLKKSFDEVTPKLGLNYRFSDDLLGYLQYSRGFQAGGFQTLCFGNLAAGAGGCGGNVYRPETVDSLELGAKSNLAGNTLRVNAAAFYAMYHDLQDTLVGPAGNFPTANVGDVDVYGFELELNWQPIDRLHMFATLGIQDNGRIDRHGTTAGCQNPQNGCTLAATDLPSLPNISARVGFDHSVAFSDAIDFLYGMDAYYTDSYFSESRNLLKIPSFIRLNAFFGIGEPGGRWQIVLAGKNVTDREDNVSGLYAGGFTNIRSPLPPAEYMLTAKIRL